MIILPTYDAKMVRLNYFTARSFEKEAFVKYRNPQVSRDIIPNEHFINWNIPIFYVKDYLMLCYKKKRNPTIRKKHSE